MADHVNEIQIMGLLELKAITQATNHLGSLIHIVFHNKLIQIKSLILTSGKLFLTCSSILTRVTGTDFLFAALVLSKEPVSL